MNEAVVLPLSSSSILEKGCVYIKGCSSIPYFGLTDRRKHSFGKNVSVLSVDNNSTLVAYVGDDGDIMNCRVLNWMIKQ